MTTLICAGFVGIIIAYVLIRFKEIDKMMKNFDREENNENQT